MQASIFLKYHIIKIQSKSDEIKKNIRKKELNRFKVLVNK